MPDWFESSRRLTGPNLYFEECGAVIEVLACTAARARAWREQLQWMLAALSWPVGGIVVDVYASGASLAFVAPEDRLFTATEVNEWAWQSTAVGADPSLPCAPGHPAAWDCDSAAMTLRLLAKAEIIPALLPLLEAARTHGVPALHDEAMLTLGAGQGGRSWPLDALPATVDWSALHGIPTVIVTGSNGKTTTVRLVSAICIAARLQSGFNCTDGIFVGGDRVERGDYSGPSGARRVLRDTRVQVAVLETARGGILRRGLAVRHADVAIVTNISEDHFGEYGVHDLARLADAKLVVARALSTSGLLVLNADDPSLLDRAQTRLQRSAWFARDHAHPSLVAHREAGGNTCGVRNSRLILCVHGAEHDLGDIRDMPLTFSGAAAYNIGNIAAATLAASDIGIAPNMIAAVLAAFGQRREDNPGRLERWRMHGFSVLLDYAHNPDGLHGLLRVASSLRDASMGRLGLLLGQAGNRDDGAIRDLARTAAIARPDRVVLKDLDGYMRGREPGEVPKLLAEELRRAGVAADAILTVLPEVEAAQALIGWARHGDVVVLPVHNLDARAAVGTWLDALARDAAAPV